MTDQYDYIIAGAGCAGLSLAIHMIRSGKLDDKRILIIDKEKKIKNDRTWCFWETQPGLFEEIVYKKWPKAWFHGENFSGLLDLQPYQYKLIRGVDFYKHCFDIISRKENITVLAGDIQDIDSSDKETCLTVNGKKINGTYIFNSILFNKPALKKNEFWLLQHFKGWVIETDNPFFNPEETTLMDFRVEQEYGTAFVYCMPFTETRALIEYTLFTKDLLQDEQYDGAIKKYIEKFTGIPDYTITEKEFGVIPMTNHRFPAHHNNIINIGTAGGQTKASSGYTFRFIQKHSAGIVKQLILTGKPFTSSVNKRFHFYDSTLLHILHHGNLPGKKVFTDLFKKNKPQRVLRFLDNESSLQDELKIISSLPTWPFLKAAIRQL